MNDYYFDYDSYYYSDDYLDDPTIRENILRDAAEEVLWDSQEFSPEELQLLEDF